jgi:hypothetical protein
MALAALCPGEARAQGMPPAPRRDPTWDLVSNVAMVASVAVVTLTPRIYYNDPEATLGWKGRWHISVLAPAMTMTALTLLVDGPLRGAIASPRPGCGLDQTQGSCATFGGPSTQAYAAWGATGAGTGIFLVDTLRHSNRSFSAPSLLLNVIVPLSLSVVTSVGRAATSGTSVALEDPGQIAAGALTGFVSGLIFGGAYAFLQRPACPYGNAIVCW